MSFKKRVFKITILLLVLLLLYITYVSKEIYDYSKINDYKKSDVVIVLGAAIWGSEPSPVFKERIDHGIWLYKNGFAENIIFTGGIGKNKLYSEAVVAKNYALRHLVKSENIYVETKSKITEENIKYAMDIVKNNEFNDVIIVSDPLHMKRAMDMAGDYGFVIYSSPTPTTRYVSFKSKCGFLIREVFFYTGYKLFEFFSFN